MGNDLVVKVLADHLATDIRNAISAECRAFLLYVCGPFYAPALLFTSYRSILMYFICVCKHPFTISAKPLYAGWTNACM